MTSSNTYKCQIGKNLITKLEFFLGHSGSHVSDLNIMRIKTKTPPGMSNLAYKLGQIGPQMGQVWDFFQITFSTSDLKISQICPFWGQFDPIGCQIRQPCVVCQPLCSGMPELAPKLSQIGTKCQMGHIWDFLRSLLFQCVLARCHIWGQT